MVLQDGAKVAPEPHTPPHSHTAAASPSSRQASASRGELSEAQVERPAKTLRQRISITMEDPEYSPLAKSISIFMMFVILISTVCFILESEVCDGMAPSCAPPTTGFLAWDPWSFIFYYAEWVSVLIFTTDYIVRFCTCGGPREMWSFFWSVMNLIDLVAWLPFWIIGASSSPPFGLPTRDASGVGGVGFVRAIRLVRVFRVFKAGKLRLGIKLFSGAMVASVEPMSILGLVLTVTVIIFSSIIWLIEKPDSKLIDDHLCLTTGMCDEERMGMQQLCFGTIPSCFWWTLSTMTTVGYGDCYPITIPGKIFAVIVMMGGISVLALPITVLGSNFEKMVSMYAEDAKTIASSSMQDDGMISELELREFLVTKKQEGALRKDVDIFVPNLMAKYDKDGRGQLTLDEFQKLEERVCIRKVADPEAEARELKALVRATAEQMAELLRRFEVIEQRLGVPGSPDIPDLDGTPVPARDGM